jgi:hypothetical protein
LKFDPFDRLQETAARISTEQPTPPRAVSMVRLFRAAASPVLALGAVPLLAILLFVAPVARLQIVLIFVLAALWAAFMSLLMAYRVRGPLLHGVMVEAEVVTVERVSRSGLRGRVRVDHSGRRFEADYAWRRPGKVRPGDRIQALIDPSRDGVLWCLGLSRGLA